VQSANASNSASDRAALNNESSQLIAEIDRVAGSSNFNGISLLNGSFANQNFQVGANGTSSNNISISSIASAKSSSLGVGSGFSYSSKIAGASGVITDINTGGLNSGDLVINNVNVGATTSDGVSYASGNASAIAKAAAINAVSGNTNVTATARATQALGFVASEANPAPTEGYTEIKSGDITINGVDLGALAAVNTAAERGAQVSAAINEKTAQTGVTATFDTNTGSVNLNAADGRNITIETKGADADGNPTTRAADANTGLNTNYYSTANGGAGDGSTSSIKTYVGSVDLNSTAKEGITLTNGGTGQVNGAALTYATPASGADTVVPAGDLQINGVAIGPFTADSAGENLIAAINAKTSQTGVSAVAGENNNLTLFSTQSDGTVAGVGGPGFVVKTSGVATKAVTGFDQGTTTVNGQGTTAAGLLTGKTDATVTAGAGVSSLDLSTAQGSLAALATIDGALQSINSSRASLGAYQNRFASAVYVAYRLLLET